MPKYINTHPNPIHIVVDGVLRLVGSGEEFNSNSAISYECIKPVLKEPKTKKTRVKDGNKPTS
jgi:hypothetical protein|tara:strand:- start:6396 stop:6584 length:189 start_codon:yes stop_codon:yes gene_type:complete